MTKKNLNTYFEFQSTMSLRERIIEILFNLSSYPYRKYVKTSEKWNVTKSALLHYPQGSIGHELGLFLESDGFDLLEKSEKHDVFHVITNYSTSIVDEIAMQYFLLGNGKRSPYLFFVIAIGTFYYPDKLNYFKTAYQKGKVPKPFFNFDFYNHLGMNLNEFKNSNNL